jgi:hypothetical protein
MGKRHRRSTVLRANFIEKFYAGTPTGIFQVQAVIIRHFLDIDAAGFKRNCIPSGQQAAEFLVCIRFNTTQAVIQVCGDQAKIVPLQPCEDIKESGRVRTAGKCHDESIPRVKETQPTDGVLDPGNKCGVVYIHGGQGVVQ